MAKRRRSGAKKFQHPRDEYIYSPERIGAEELTKRWAHKGWTVDRIKKGCASKSYMGGGGWKRDREEFWKKVRLEAAESATKEISREMSDSIIDATHRHKKLGLALQGVAGELITEARHMMRTSKEGLMCGSCGAPVNVPKLRPGEAFRVGVTSAKEGVGMERTALGLVEKKVKVEVAREYGVFMVEIMSKYVDDPAVLRNVARDLKEYAAKEEEELAALVERGEVLH